MAISNFPIISQWKLYTTIGTSCGVLIQLEQNKTIHVEANVNIMHANDQLHLCGGVFNILRKFKLYVFFAIDQIKGFGQVI